MKSVFVFAPSIDTHIHKIFFHIMRKVLEDGDLANKLLWSLTGGEDCTLTQLCVVMHRPASQNSHVSFKSSGLTNSFQSCTFRFMGYLLFIRQQAHMGAVIEEDTDRVVRQLVTKSILVGVVHPFSHPLKAAVQALFWNVISYNKKKNIMKSGVDTSLPVGQC